MIKNIDVTILLRMYMQDQNSKQEFFVYDSIGGKLGCVV